LVVLDVVVVLAPMVVVVLVGVLRTCRPRWSCGTQTVTIPLHWPPWPSEAVKLTW